MLAVAIKWALYGLLLKLSIAVIGSARDGENGFLKAFGVAAILAAVGYGLSFLPLTWLLAPIAWLLIVKTAYDIGWLRALGVAIVLNIISILVVMFVLLPLGLAAAVL